jgi:hypothetical protein
LPLYISAIINADTCVAFHFNLSARLLFPYLAHFYRQLWSHVRPSNYRALVLAVLEHDIVLSSDKPETGPSLLILSPWSQFLPRLLRQIGHTGAGRQLLLPSGEWDMDLEPERLFVCLAAALDQQLDTLCAAFDVLLDARFFAMVGFKSDDIYPDMNFQASAINGKVPLGNIAPAGYGRLIDPVRHSGAHLFFELHAGAMIVLTWPRYERNYLYIRSLLSDDPSDELSGLDQRRYGLSPDTIGGMIDGTLMDGCQAYFAQGERVFDFGPDVYAAVVALETVVFVTLPLYSVHARAAFQVLKAAASMLPQMTGERREEMKQHLTSSWNAMMASEEGSNKELSDRRREAMKKCEKTIRKALK